MAYEEFTWNCADGTAMYACEWSPELRRDTKAVIGIVHGMGEHTGRYSHVAQRFNEDGYAVLLFDQRGHGRTAGQRGHTPDYEQLLEGVDKRLDEARLKYP
ncbi:MAG: lysophospholipase, partial [Paenibacillus sp.]|nr:lysophospholipase [Paenibacillus sp.]